jgi:hypothetical protein
MMSFKRKGAFGGLGVVSTVVTLSAIAGVDCTNATPPPGSSGVDASFPAPDATLADDTGAPGVDASDATVQDSALSVADGGGHATDAAPDAACSLSAALGSPILPLRQIAGLNYNESGPGLVSLSYAQSVLCGSGTIEEDAGADPGMTLVTWGAHQDLTAEYDDNGLLYLMTASGSYSGSLQFNSRTGGAYGAGHSYVIGVGRLTKDGAPFVIDWGGSPGAQVNEIFDGMMATFAPSYPVDPDCTADGTCIVGDLTCTCTDDGGSGKFCSDGGCTPGKSYFGLRTVKIYAVMNGDATSIPSTIYTVFDGEPGLPDAGVPGVPGDGGLALPAGCVQENGGGIGATCEDPYSPLCSNLPGTTVVSCQDWPQSGLTVTCCPTDGG